MTKGFLKTRGTKIVSGDKEICLRGVNLGGWLMPEGYIMHAPNRAHRFFKSGFIKTLGPKMFADLETSFRDCFIVEADIARMKTLGFNCIRVPFHHALVETKPFAHSKDGVRYLDRVIGWATKHNLRIILDMHAVPGSQNHDWHSDSDGRARFWASLVYQRRAVALWEFLADRYKNVPAVAGYDLLNETVLDNPALLNRYYRAAITVIRSVDRNHIIFVEGNRWAQDIACLDEFSDDNLALSVHFYEPLEFTFNFIPGLKYPLGKGKKFWGRDGMRKRLEASKRIADRRHRALLCGEFGVNARGGIYGEDRWLEDILAHFKAMDIHWTYWTWKAMKNHMFPDGIYSYYPNDPWVNRPGPLAGWDAWAHHWPTRKKDMTASWRTENFQANKEILNVLRTYAR